MALLQISVIPVGTGSASYSSAVASACREAQRNGIKFNITPTSTVLEGDLPALIDVAHHMHRAAFDGGTQRVVTSITIEERRDRDLRMEPTVQAVTASLH